MSQKKSIVYAQRFSTRANENKLKNNAVMNHRICERKNAAVFYCNLFCSNISLNAFASASSSLRLLISM